ncbi:MAG: type II toxin-antitoxin system prevent-host-death family antitoxin [Actinomycetaceae bacterium]|nr:type II toxin-antitoxin system prevent-host-death family antitoxin [Actinomycetaceae bacterium]
MSVIDPIPETLSQRELRNESGRVLRAVKEGQEFVLTNAGEPVGRIVPLDAVPASLPVTRPAKRRGGWADLPAPTQKPEQSLSDILDDLRADRV